MQTVRVHKLLGGPKILPKRSAICVGRTNVTDDRQTTDRQTDRRTDRQTDRQTDGRPML